MSLITYDIQNLYERQFGSKPVIPAAQNSAAHEPYKINGNNPEQTKEGNLLYSKDARGIEIWLPLRFFGLDASVFGSSELFLPYSVVNISSKKTIVKTPLPERIGTVKEQYTIEDWDISVKGFIIGYDSTNTYPVWPERDLKLLKQLYLINSAIQIDNAKLNIFIGDDHKVVIESLDFPEVQGGRKNVVPFTFNLCSDTVFTLELK